MPASNLSKILGPTILGYSCPEPNPTAMLAETGLQSIAMEKLIGIDSDYWGSYVNDDQVGALNNLESTIALFHRIVLLC